METHSLFLAVVSHNVYGSYFDFEYFFDSILYFDFVCVFSNLEGIFTLLADEVHAAFGDDRLQDYVLSVFHYLYTSWILFTASLVAMKVSCLIIS